jgi:hypothetical protein
MSHMTYIRVSRILALLYQMLDAQNKYFSPGELDAQSKKARNRAPRAESREYRFGHRATANTSRQLRPDAIFRMRSRRKNRRGPRHAHKGRRAYKARRHGTAFR